MDHRYHDSSYSRGFALLPPAPSRQLACVQESSFQDLGGSLIGGSEGFEGSIIRILLGSDALGSLILFILRGSEALRRSIICILCVPKPPGAQNWNSEGLGAAILDTFITSGGLEPPPTRDILILNIVNVLKTICFSQFLQESHQTLKVFARLWEAQDLRGQAAGG